MNYHIRPCPECGVVPEKVMMGAPERFVAVKPTCGHVYQDGIVSAISWNAHCVRMMHDALDATGIVTIAELTERLAPDPRVAVLEIALTKLAESDLSQVPYSQIKAHIEEALFRSQFIAAQRGEGYK